MAKSTEGSLKAAVQGIGKRLAHKNLDLISEKVALTIFNSIKVIKQIYKLWRDYRHSFEIIAPFLEEIYYQLKHSKLHDDRFNHFLKMVQVARMYLGLNQKKS